MARFGVIALSIVCSAHVYFTVAAQEVSTQVGGEGLETRRSFPDARQQELWKLLHRGQPAHNVLTPFWKLTSAEEIVDVFEAWLHDEELAGDEHLRKRIYGHLFEPSLASTIEGAKLLIDGLTDKESYIKRSSAVALVRFAPEELREEIDVALKSYLDSPNSSLEDESVLLKLCQNSAFASSQSIVQYAVRQISEGRGDEINSFWAVQIVLANYGVESVAAILEESRTQSTILGMLRGWYIYRSLSEVPERETERERERIRSAVLKLLEHVDEEIRTRALIVVFSLLGPTPYSASDEQLAINSVIITAVNRMRQGETDGEIIKHIDEYVLPAFNANGRLKSKEEWRADTNR